MWPSRKLPDQALASLRSNRQIGCAREAFGSLPAGNRSWQLTGRASLNPTARIGHPTRATLTSIPERLANAFEDSFLFRIGRASCREREYVERLAVAHM